MRKVVSILPRWLPAVLVMTLIFVFSSIPGPDLPSLGFFDVVGKKTAHVVVYALLAGAFWYAFRWRRDLRLLAWLLAVLYAATDEFHQAFTPGRHPWWLDVVVFDALGALLGLWLAGMLTHAQPDAEGPEG